MYPTFIDVLSDAALALFAFFARTEVLSVSLALFVVGAFVVVRADRSAGSRLVMAAGLGAGLGYVLPVLSVPDTGGVLLAMFAVPAFVFVALTVGLCRELLTLATKRAHAGQSRHR